jgi:hypothetical protein
MRATLRYLLLGAALALGLPNAAEAARSSVWPPVKGPGTLFAHIGEEHVTDEDGMRILPRAAVLAAAYRPRAVFASGDKANDGTEENFALWEEALMPLQRAGVPVYAAVGNHDRKHKPGFPEGVDPTGDLANYERFFAPRPYPWGDAAPVAEAGFGPAQRPAEDPAGASSHYFLDIGRTRWIVLDNSCFTLTFCDDLQNPPFPDGGANGQFEYLALRAQEAAERDMTVFVVMHMPTQDPRPGHTEPTLAPHTMGEGTAPDNAQFEQAAAAAGVDGVFVGHVKGMFIYQASEVPYFTDGGAGGEVYVGENEETGVDYGYWHGLRLVRVLADGRIETDAVPIFAPGGVEMSGPRRAAPGADLAYEAIGRQPTQDGPMVDLELRAPDPERPNVANLPTPSYVWTSGDRTVLRPRRGPDDDARNDRRTQTQTGRFAATCPGRTSVSIISGTERAARSVRVRSGRGVIVRSVKRGPRTLTAGRRSRLGAVRLAQPARVRATLRGEGTRASLSYRCHRRGLATIRGTVPRNARPGRYTLTVRVLSDRKPLVRRFALRVLGRG